jgi:hypothetical protein
VERTGSKRRVSSYGVAGPPFTKTLCVIRECRAPEAELSYSEASDMSTAKEELTRLIQGQPEDSSREEIVRELAFHVMVERGLADSDAKRAISNEEMGRRIRSWQK